MASKEQELEWIEQPGGWEGDNCEESEEEAKKSIKHADDNADDDADDDDEEYGGFDLFGEPDPSLTFPFEIPLAGGKAVKLKLEGFTLDSDETAQSTGVTLWQAAPRLARFLSEHTNLVVGKSVLELGAGLGLCGMVAHHLGAESVVLTDADTITLERMRSNLAINCPTKSDSKQSIISRQLIWNNIAQMRECGTFDTVLGADVIYTIGSLDPLFDTVAYFLGKEEGESANRCFVLSRYTKYGNIQDETVLDAARARNLVWTRPSEGIFVFRLGTTNAEDES